MTGTSATLAWNAPGGTVTSYNVYRNGTLVGSSPTPSFTDPGLTSAQTYSYTVTAVGNNVESPATAALSVTTPDVVAPSAPTGLTAPTVGATHVVVSWTASTDNVGVTGYDLVRDGTVVASTNGLTSAGDTTVVPKTSYRYTVRAKDAAGNVSQSDPLVVTTPDGTDLTPPSVPQNLRTTGQGTTQIGLAWDPSTDDTGVTGYIVTRNGVDLPATTQTALTDGLLIPDTTYTYTVRATDAALNVSAASAPLAVSTHSTTETLITKKSVWKYTDDGVDRGTAWRNLGYDDSTWKSGAGILGYNQGDETTVLYNGGAVQNRRYVSHYFRKSLTVSDSSRITGLTLSLLRTDGAVVYVNGVEALPRQHADGDDQRRHVRSQRAEPRRAGAGDLPPVHDPGHDAPRRHQRHRGLGPPRVAGRYRCSELRPQPDGPVPVAGASTGSDDSNATEPGKLLLQSG